MITIEDYNTQRLNLVNGYFGVDTSIIGTHEFEDVKLEFCKVSHSVSGSSHTFTFEILNSDWTGGYWFSETDGTYIASDGTYSNNKLSITTSEESIVLNVYLCSFHPSFNVVRFSNILVDCDAVLSTSFPFTETLTVRDLSSGSDSELDFNFSTGGVNNPYRDCYLMVYHTKLELTPSLAVSKATIGKINKIYLSNISESDLTMEIKYGSKVIPVVEDDDRYYFNLDLTDLTIEKTLKLELVIYENSNVNQGNVDLTLRAEYLVVTSFADLVNEIAYGTELLKLGNDLRLSSNVNVNHDLVIYGQAHTLTCIDNSNRRHGFKIGDDCTVKVDSIQFNNADTLFSQGLGSKLTLKDCSFTNCSSETYNQLGSVVYCDVDLESLAESDDFITIIDNCSFTNCFTPLFTGGELTVTDSTFSNNSEDYVDKHNPCFIYLTDGLADIINSSFNIDLDCENALGFGQALFYLGESAQINSSSLTDLRNGNLNWSNANYNNTSSIYCRYPYSIDDETVTLITSGLTENDSYCYSLSNDEVLYKHNVSITRESD